MRRELNSAAGNGDTVAAEECLVALVEEGFVPGPRAYHGLLFAYCKAGDMEGALAVAERASEAGKGAHALLHHHCAVLCCAVLCCAVLLRRVLCCTVTLCAVLCCYVVCCVVLCWVELRIAELQITGCCKVTAITCQHGSQMGVVNPDSLTLNPKVFLGCPPGSNV